MWKNKMMKYMGKNIDDNDIFQLNKKSNYEIIREREKIKHEENKYVYFSIGRFENNNTLYSVLDQINNKTYLFKNYNSKKFGITTQYVKDIADNGLSFELIHLICLVKNVRLYKMKYGSNILYDVIRNIEYKLKTVYDNNMKDDKIREIICKIEKYYKYVPEDFEKITILINKDKNEMEQADLTYRLKKVINYVYSVDHTDDDESEIPINKSVVDRIKQEPDVMIPKYIDTCSVQKNENVFTIEKHSRLSSLI